jgi:hypothetical protein
LTPPPHRQSEHPHSCDEQPGRARLGRFDYQAEQHVGGLDDVFS